MPCAKTSSRPAPHEQAAGLVPAGICPPRRSSAPQEPLPSSALCKGRRWCRAQRRRLHLHSVTSLRVTVVTFPPRHVQVDRTCNRAGGCATRNQSVWPDTLSRQVGAGAFCREGGPGAPATVVGPATQTRECWRHGVDWVVRPLQSRSMWPRLDSEALAGYSVWRVVIVASTWYCTGTGLSSPGAVNLTTTANVSPFVSGTVVVRFSV